MDYSLETFTDIETEESAIQHTNIRFERFMDTNTEYPAIQRTDVKLKRLSSTMTEYPGIQRTDIGVERLMYTQTESLATRVNIRLERFTETKPEQPVTQRTGIRIERFRDTKTLQPSIKRTLDFPFPKRAASLDFASILELLRQEQKNNLLYKEVWLVAEEILERNKAVLLCQNAQEVPNECHIALIAYTLSDEVIVNGKNLQLYEQFNEECRKLELYNNWEKFPYKSFYCLLVQSFHGVKSRRDISKLLYRGVTFHYPENEFVPDDNTLYNFTQFTSFSSNVHVAEEFKRDKGTILVFENSPMAAINLEHHSRFLHEEEVLICPWSTFTICCVNKENETHIIHLKSGGPHFFSLPYNLK